MAELLVRNVDKEKSGDVYTDVLRTEEGDVIAICGDGWKWSKAEKDAPYWDIVKVPGVLAEQLESFLAPDPPLLGVDSKGDPIKNKVARRRAFSLDLKALKKAIKDGVPVDEALMLSLKKTKVKVKDPAEPIKGLVIE